MARHRTAGAGSDSSRTRLIHPAPFRAPRILLIVIGRRSAASSASPSRDPGNGILRAETGGRFQAQNTGERSEFGSQTAARLATDGNCEGFCRPGNRVGFLGLDGGRCRDRTCDPSRLSIRRPNSHSRPFRSARKPTSTWRSAPRAVPSTVSAARRASIVSACSAAFSTSTTVAPRISPRPSRGKYE